MGESMEFRARGLGEMMEMRFLELLHAKDVKTIHDEFHPATVVQLLHQMLRSIDRGTSIRQGGAALAMEDQNDLVSFFNGYVHALQSTDARERKAWPHELVALLHGLEYEHAEVAPVIASEFNDITDEDKASVNEEANWLGWPDIFVKGH